MSAVSGSVSQLSTSGRQVHEALVLHQPEGPAALATVGRLDRPVAIRNRMCRIGDVAVDASSPPSGSKRSRSLGAGNRVAGRWCGCAAARRRYDTHSFDAGLKRERFRLAGVLPLSFSQYANHGACTFVAKVRLGVARRNRYRRACALTPGPAAVIPRARRPGNSDDSCPSSRASRRSSSVRRNPPGPTSRRRSGSAPWLLPGTA